MKVVLSASLISICFVAELLLLVVTVELAVTVSTASASAFIVHCHGCNHKQPSSVLSSLTLASSSPSQSFHASLSCFTGATTSGSTFITKHRICAGSSSGGGGGGGNSGSVLRSSSIDGDGVSFDNDNDDNNDIEERTIRFERPTSFIPQNDFTVIEDDDDDGDDGFVGSNYYNTQSRSYAPTATPKKSGAAFSRPGSTLSTRPRRPLRTPKRKSLTDGESMAGTSWMEKNAKFTNDDDNQMQKNEANAAISKIQSNRGRNGIADSSRSISDPKTFRQDFRKTRVFVQGIPTGVSWQDLKDHFRVAGNVVFASVSVDPDTGESKGHGIVQFETTDMALKAIGIMRDYPLNGHPLFVREDFQETKDQDAQLRNVPKGPTPPTKWKCANEENAMYMSEAELSSIRSLIKARDDARRRKKYDVSDRIREELKETYGVFIDDRLKMWWTSVDGSKVPQSIHDVKGDGRWKLKPWRQIPTTTENDACVNADLVEGLLKQRDIARREKDFATADSLLEEARTCPDGDLTLRIHDESRTWRVWTETTPTFDRLSSSPPPATRPFSRRRASDEDDHDPDIARKMAVSDCISIVEQHAPDKKEEITLVLQKFPGREFQILKRLKQQYLQ